MYEKIRIRKKAIFLFVIGALCFIISQPLLRLPILTYLQNKTSFILFNNLHPVLVAILIAFSAGIFEEGFRFLFRNHLIKTVEFGIIEAIIFGLGHGIAEAIILLSPYIFKVAFNILYIAIIERFLAIILHIGLSVIIWNGFQKNKKYKYLIIAILVHGLTNSLVTILALNYNSIILMEGSLVLINIFIILYIIKSKKYYYSEGNKNEKV